MADFNDNSQKGSVLMQQALKKYAEGDFEGGDKDREQANKFFDLASMQINSEAGKMTQLYGESRNFGIIYNVFEQNIENLISTKQGKKIIKEGYNLIKNNPVLSEQFKVYDLFEKINNVEDVKAFVNESSELVKTLNKNEVIKNNEKFIHFMRENKIDEYVDIPEDLEKLYESIEFIILNKKNFNNLNNFIKAEKVISEHIEKNNKNVLSESTNSQIFDAFKEKVNDAQKEIDENINDDERKLIETFTNEKKNRKHIFESHKEKTLSKINEMINASEEADKESWTNIYENIKSKEYSDNMAENITNCAEMMEIYNTIEE